MFNNIFPDKEIPHNGEPVEGEMKKNVGEKKYYETETTQKFYNNPYGTNPYGVNIEQYTDQQTLLNAVKKYCRHHTKLTSSIDHNIKYLQNMIKKDQPFPINLLEPNYTQYIYHMTWYKNTKYHPQTGKNWYALKMKKQAMEMYLKACGIPIDYFHYDLPTRPPDKPIEFPNPKTATKIVKAIYYKNKKTNYLIQFMHLYNFIIGCRPPSETACITIDDLDFDECTLIHEQAKKNHELRKVFVDPVFMKGKTRKSIKNYLDYHRDDYTTQYSKNYLFVSPWDGRPFNPPNLGKLLNTTASKIYPKWYPYMARHWCATGRLIEAYLEHDPDPIKRVQDYMYHDKRKNTEKYTKHARDYYKKYPFNWFNYILKNKTKNCLGICKKSNKRQKRGCSTQIPSIDQYSPAQNTKHVLLLEISKQIHFLRVSVSSKLKSFSFSFQNMGVAS